MDVLILAGGDGKRIKSLSKNKQKSLLKINNKTLLKHQITKISKINKKIFLSIKENDKNIFNELKSIKKNNFIFIKESKKLGTAGCLKALKNYKIKDILVIYSDILFNIDLKKFIKFHNFKKSDLTLFTHPNNHPHDSDIVEVNANSRVTNFHNKYSKKKYVGNLCLSGIYIIKKKLLSYLGKKDYQDFSKNFLPKILKKKNIKIFSYKSREYAKDIGTPYRYKTAIKEFNSDKFKKGNLNSKIPAVFLDKDGVINPDKYNYKYQSPHKFINGTFEAIKKINDKGFLAVLITNQPAVAKGFISINKLMKDFKKLESLLGYKGSYLDMIYYCPCHPEKGHKGEIKKFKRTCSWRKPNNGMLLRAISDLNINKKKSFMIGDTVNDLIAAKKTKIKFIQVGEKIKLNNIIKYKNLKDAIDSIFKN